MSTPPRPVWFALALLGAGSQEGPPRGPAGSFGEDPRWDDGKAELSRYSAEEIIEGEKRGFEAWSVIVAESFDARQMVKKEEFDLGNTPVLKCNWFLEIPTGVSRYHQMASLFLRRSDLLVMKAAFSSQEWCGITFQEWRRDRPGLEVHSYFEGEGDRTWELAELGADHLFLEQVPLWVRGRRPEHARTEKIQLIEKRLATARAPAPRLVAATIAFLGPQDEAPGRRLHVELRREGATDTFVLAPDFPHTLLEWRRGDGTTWTLVKTLRLDYWNCSKNEFADFLAR